MSLSPSLVQLARELGLTWAEGCAEAELLRRVTVAWLRRARRESPESYRELRRRYPVLSRQTIARRKEHELDYDPAQMAAMLGAYRDWLASRGGTDEP